MLALSLLLIGVASRFLPHAPNFSPVIAIALFGGVYLRRSQALWLPLVLMMLTDLVLGLHATVPFTWGSVLAAGVIGLWARQNPGASRIIGGAVVFSIEQVILDLDIAAYQHQLCQGIGGAHFAESLALIREKGIGGLYLDTEHTALNFRESLVMPQVMTRLKSTDVPNALAHDPVDAAHARCKDILARTPMYTIDDARRRAIDKVVESAAKELASVRGALV